MKIVLPCWGLGNVMFMYAFYCELGHRFPDEACCFFVYKRMLFEHNGYELDNLFKITYFKRCNSFQKGFMKLVDFLGALRIPVFKLMSKFFKEVNAKENFLYDDTVFRHANENCYYKGTWQSPFYFSHVEEEIRKTFQFDRSMISSYARGILNQIEHTPNSVSLHVRRGDYLKPAFEGFTKCCPIEYFERAIQYVKEHTQSPRFFIFSDDMDYVREHLTIEDAVFVDGNKGADSWQDMFLMSVCTHNIIPNSTFSWWSAFLNSHEEKIVVAPKRWWYYLEKDDVIPKEWIRL